MSFMRAVTLTATLAMAAVPAVAQSESDAEYRNAVSTFITMQGFACGSVLSVTQREEANAFDVVCSANANGSGDTTSYFFQLTGEGAVVKPQ